jgi:hypothetical protein
MLQERDSFCSAFGGLSSSIQSSGGGTTGTPSAPETVPLSSPERKVLPLQHSSSSQGFIFRFLSSFAAPSSHFGESLVRNQRNGREHRTLFRCVNFHGRNQRNGQEHRTLFRCHDRIANGFIPALFMQGLIFCFLSLLTAPSSSTPGSSVNGTNATAVATGPCSGVIIDYAVGSVSMIPPLADPQPFRFEATATLQNIGSRTLKVEEAGHLFFISIFPFSFDLGCSVLFLSRFFRSLSIPVFPFSFCLGFPVLNTVLYTISIVSMFQFR